MKIYGQQLNSGSQHQNGIYYASYLYKQADQYLTVLLVAIINI